MEIIDGFNNIKKFIQKHIGDPSADIQIVPPLPQKKSDSVSENYTIIVKSNEKIKVSREELEDSKKDLRNDTKNKIKKSL